MGEGRGKAGRLIRRRDFGFVKPLGFQGVLEQEEGQGLMFCG